MTDSKREANDLITRLVKGLPDSAEKTAAEAQLSKLPGLNVHGEMSQVAITLSGPINFTMNPKPARRP